MNWCNKIICIDCLTGLKELPDNSIDCCITSPPYWALRNYCVDGQIGSEPTVSQYVNNLCDVFDEVKRVLKVQGTAWINLGDTYAGSSNGTNNFSTQKSPSLSGKRMKFNNLFQGKQKRQFKEFPDKCLSQAPSRFSIEMVNRGWILRNKIIWWKPNSMPSPAKDRFTVDYEEIFFFVKNKKYYFEQQFELYTEPLNRWGGVQLEDTGKSVWSEGTGQKFYRKRDMRPNKNGRNKRCVWPVCTRPNFEHHFATYPEQLIYPMIKAGCPENGIVLDPFIGSGTTAVIAKKMNRNYIGFELNPDYQEMANNRIAKEFGLFL